MIGITIQNSCTYEISLFRISYIVKKCRLRSRVLKFWVVQPWLFASLRNQRSLGDCSGTRTHNHFVHNWTSWLNCWVFVYQLSDRGFESRCSYLNFRFRACFEQGVPWHSGNYKVWIHSETRRWHDKNIQSTQFNSPQNCSPVKVKTV